VEALEIMCVDAKLKVGRGGDFLLPPANSLGCVSRRGPGDFR
jgi:hypothetical protein